MSYDIKLHVHNFAVWTAARAVQRNFARTKAIKKAIDSTNLRDLIDGSIAFNSTTFDNFHRKTATQIISALSLNEKSLAEKATYGRAAKIIAVYIKTIAVIRQNERSNLALFAHPPIDSILLKNMHKDYNQYGLNKINWTQLDETEYFKLLENLRNIAFEMKEPFWMLEKYWDPSDEKKQ
jgi:hypothetical protein